VIDTNRAARTCRKSVREDPLLKVPPARRGNRNAARFQSQSLRHFAPPIVVHKHEDNPAFQRKCNHLCLASLSRCPDGSRKGGVRHLGALYDPYSCNSSQFRLTGALSELILHPLWNENSRVDLPKRLKQLQPLQGDEERSVSNRHYSS
jgi:hypothetical protein